MSAPVVVNLAEKLAAFDDHWKPHIVGHYNGNEIRVAKIGGDFTWHSHPETDEMFLVIKGEMGIEFRDGVRHFGAGEMVVVPKGVEHRPFAAEECHILFLDREGEPNTGDTPSHRTRAKLESI
jgi:mannose-6-phosphate isomerase-like protein (cupin superfamily)